MGHSSPSPRRLVRVHAPRRSEPPHLDGGSSYIFGTGVAVLTGSPGSLSAVTCFPSLGGFLATAGVTYHIGVDDISRRRHGGRRSCTLPSNAGGRLKVDRFGRFDPKTGSQLSPARSYARTEPRPAFPASCPSAPRPPAQARTPSSSPATAQPQPAGRLHSLPLTASSRAAPPTYCWASPSVASPAGASARPSSKGPPCAGRDERLVTGITLYRQQGGGPRCSGRLLWDRVAGSLRQQRGRHLPRSGDDRRPVIAAS